MVNKGAIEMFLQLMKQINNNTKENDTYFSKLGHLLVQVCIYFFSASTHFEDKLKI